MKRIIVFILVCLLCAAMFGCNETEQKSTGETSKVPQIADGTINFNVEGNEVEMSNYETKNPVVALYVKDYGTIVVELYPEIAPNTVNNFISLVKKGFYDNNSIHRMLPGFMLQGGDPNGKGSGGPGYSIKGEFSMNGFKNDLLHTEGVISMARADKNYDSAGSQFFIMFDAVPHLDGGYAAFGKVIEGMEVCHNIEKIKYYSRQTGKLNENLTIVKAVVDTKGVEYPEPEKIYG